MVQRLSLTPRLVRLKMRIKLHGDASLIVGIMTTITAINNTCFLLYNKSVSLSCISYTFPLFCNARLVSARISSPGTRRSCLLQALEWMYFHLQVSLGLRAASLYQKHECL
jgi:hypothetical protein